MPPFSGCFSKKSRDIKICNCLDDWSTILFETKDLKKSKSKTASIKIKKINPDIKVKFFQTKITRKNIKKIASSYDVLVDGSDNFNTKFLVNDFCIKGKKILITGAINKFDGQVFTFNFKKRNSQRNNRC